MEYFKKAEEQTLYKHDVKRKVEEIISIITEKGDQGLIDLTKIYDKVTRSSIKLESYEIDHAWQWFHNDRKRDMEFIAERIRNFAEFQLKMFEEKEKAFSTGIVLGYRVLPINSCACYIPGGRYPLLTSALMSIIPAKVAGVKRIVACSPPGPDGNIHPGIICAIGLAGADEIYCMGGAQAITALALGTESVEKVDKIVGPGNVYVTEAKRQLNGFVGIDLLAGPSEVVIIADASADIEYLAADLLAQAEHDIDARAILICSSKSIAQNTLKELNKQLHNLETSVIAKKSWLQNGEIIIVNDLIEAAIVSNNIAPEHLQLNVEDPDELLSLLFNYGSLFIGKYSPVVFGDKVSGTNHILPTGGSARFSEGLWVGSFLRVATYQRLTKSGAKMVAPVAARQSEREGFAAHKRSAELRL